MTQDSLAKKKGVADIVFLLDISGSMQPCLDALKDNIASLIEFMTNPGPNEPAVVQDWRIKICGYRDVLADGDAWWVESDFTNDLSAARAQLDDMKAEGGGDEPESLLDGLWRLSRLPVGEKGEVGRPDAWRHHHDAARCVIVFTDASCHMVAQSAEAGGASFDDVAREVMAARLRLSIYCPEADCYQSVAAIDKCEIEFVGSLSDAVNKMAEFSRDRSNFRKTMQQLAKSISVSAATPVL